MKKRTTTPALVALALLPLLAPSALAAQMVHGHDASKSDVAGYRGEVLADLADAESKVVGLAEAIPESAYDWRPMEGVRSVPEVFTHIIGMNYFFPTMLGAERPADMPEEFRDRKTAASVRDKATLIRGLKASFAFERQVIENLPDSRLDESVTMFGRETTVRGFLLSWTADLHEHLGQLIAYARSNQVVPPWSE